MLRTRTAILLAIAVGVSLELGIHAITGRREAWDAPQYWTMGFPAVLAAAFLVGILSSRRDWLWTILIVPSQVVAMMARAREIGNLWPLTLVLSAVLSAPFVFAAFLGSKCRRTR